MNIKIRKWRLSYAEELAAILSNRKILNNLRDGLPYPYTVKDAEEYILAMLSADENSTFAYAVTADDRVVGSIGAFRQSNIHNHTAELGYYIAKEYWGAGICTEAVKQITKYIFESTDIIRIYAEPFSYNIGSCRALEKAGFQYEGTMRNNAVKNGKVQDMKMYALTRSIGLYTVRRLAPEQIPEAISLVWEVFRRFEEAEYSDEGVEEFRSFLDNKSELKKPDFYGALCDDKLTGVLAMRKNHISLFFVDEKYHKRGIGKMLFEAMQKDFDNKEFTVNSSPYAVKIYERLGFETTDTEQITNGIRYTPMRFDGKGRSGAK